MADGESVKVAVRVRPFNGVMRLSASAMLFHPSICAPACFCMKSFTSLSWLHSLMPSAAAARERAFVQAVRANAWAPNDRDQP